MHVVEKTKQIGNIRKPFAVFEPKVFLNETIDSEIISHYTLFIKIDDIKERTFHLEYNRNITITTITASSVFSCLLCLAMEWSVVTDCLR